MPLTPLLQRATALPLNSVEQAPGIWAALEQTSPHADPQGEDVYVFAERFDHILDHALADATPRKKRVGWVEPTLTRPLEIRKTHGGGVGRVYLNCVQGYLQEDPERSQFFVVIVDDRDHRPFKSVVTMHPVTRDKDVQKLRKEAVLWQA